MAYLGRPGATAPLTSADIPDDSITAAKIVDGAIDFQDEIGFLENKATTQNLSGTYSTERMYLNDSYTLTGDVTVTGHLALGTVADGDVIITQDSTERTITGSGTLESGELLHRPDTSDLTGMTGELGSAVTGSPALNLSNATFPAGMTLQTKVAQIAEAISGITATGSATEIHSGLRIDFTPVSSSSKIIFTIHAGNAIAQSADIELRVRYHTSSNTAPNTNFSNNKTSADRQGASGQQFTLNHLTFEDSWSGLRCVSPTYGSSNGNTVVISNSTHVTFFMVQEISQ